MQLNMLDNKLKNALCESHNAYEVHGARSNKKLKILHKHLAERLQKRLGKEYEIRSFGIGDGTEHQIEGTIYPKRTDITVLRDNRVLGAIGVKLIMSNLHQNANNYLENMIGETLNIRGANLLYSQILIIRNPLPYLKKDSTEHKKEKVREKTLRKYKKLFDVTADQYGVPNSIFILLVDLRDKKDIKDSIGEVENLDKEIKGFYLNNSNLEEFIKEYATLIKDR